MRYLREAPLELPRLADLGIIFFLFFSSASTTAFIILSWSGGCTCQLIVRQAREMHQALLQMDGEPCTVQVGLLFICVDVV
jgi:hypothetical protein